jgi:hypothetical protein
LRSPLELIGQIVDVEITGASKNALWRAGLSQRRSRRVSRSSKPRRTRREPSETLHFDDGDLVRMVAGPATKTSR